VTEHSPIDELQPVLRLQMFLYSFSLVLNARLGSAEHSLAIFGACEESQTFPTTLSRCVLAVVGPCSIPLSIPLSKNILLRARTYMHSQTSRLGRCLPPAWLAWLRSAASRATPAEALYLCTASVRSLSTSLCAIFYDVARLLYYQIKLLHRMAGYTRQMV